MTYLTFHLIFLLPPIAIMLATYKRPRKIPRAPRVDLGVPLICLIALSYTTPWDNYLVAQRIWWYGPERVMSTIGHVPVEEYLFFVLQPLLTGLFLYHYLYRRNTSPRTKSSSTRAAWIGTAFFASLTGLGILFLTSGTPNTRYLGLILVWAPPLLAGMWLYDGESLWALRRPLLVGTIVPTFYLWTADAIAIHSGIWTISSRYTIGISTVGLPLEEASFFLLTNLLVVQGILLLLYGSHEAVTTVAPRSLDK